ncbi:MAG: acyl-CoA dehydrogenase family protein [Magnetospiraceae bacterium]
MKPFAAPLNDILFCMNEVAGATALDHWDPEFAGQLGEHFAGFAEGEIAPIDEPGDQQGCRLENGRVRMPDGFVQVYQAYAENGWPSLTIPEEYGGQGLDALMLAITSEIFTGACHSLQMVTGLVPGAVNTILRFGTEDQKARFIPPMASGECLATMCLTEPGAGSDLSRIRCKAVEEADGWTLHGEKIFISGGDQDMSPSILHLVLARTGPHGIKDLSLFLCPSANSDGTRNAVSVTRIEEKMGLHASPTCQLAFDGAKAELVGKPGDGLKAMFTIMNHARSDVALQGVAHAARAHDVALAYAAERTQGRKEDGSPAVLSDHADVKRMLDEMDLLAMSGRAMAHLAFVTMETGDNPALVEMLTPVVKVFCTEAGMRAAELGVQVLGGYGYLQEYRLEQTYRDARITAIYEGANGIHARMLATRLLGSKPADAFEAFLSAENDQFQNAALATCLQSWREAREALLAKSYPTPQAHDFMVLTGLALSAAVLSRMTAVADHHPDPARIRRVATIGLRDSALLAPVQVARITA